MKRFEIVDFLKGYSIFTIVIFSVLLITPVSLIYKRIINKYLKLVNDNVKFK